MPDLVLLACWKHVNGKGKQLSTTGKQCIKYNSEASLPHFILLEEGITTHWFLGLLFCRSPRTTCKRRENNSCCSIAHSLGIMNMGEKMSSAASLIFFSFYSIILLTLKTASHQFCLLMFFYIINHIMQNSVVNSLSYWGSGISVIPWTLSSPWRDASKAVFMEKVLKRTPCWWDVKLLCIPKFLLKRYTVLTYSHSFIFTLFWDAIEAAELNL